MNTWILAAGMVGSLAQGDASLWQLPAVERDFSHQVGARFASPESWTGEVVYGIMVDRFNDGDPSNNLKSLPGEYDAADIAHARHGGDLQGIRDRLDYLHDLGVTTLWLTPIFTHNGNYHGYCAINPTRIDPGFGTVQDLRDLVQDAHKRNMRVVLDVVVNHLCDPHTTYTKQPDHARCGAELDAAHWANGAPQSSAQGELQFSDTFFAPFKRQEFFNRCGPNSSTELGSTGGLAVFGDFVGGMYDYNTRNPDFTQTFIDLHRMWIAYADVDGFRLDAARHVSEDFLARFSTKIRDYAHSLGKDNFYVVAEVFGDAVWTGRRLGNMFTNPANPDDHGAVPQSLTEAIRELQPMYSANAKAPYPGPNGVFHFGAAWAGRDYVAGRAANTVGDYFVSDAYHTVAGQNDINLSLSFLDNHDLPRFVRNTPDDLWKSKLALGYLATMPGIPVLYYGMEQGFNGRCPQGASENANVRAVCGRDDDALYRQDMFVDGPWRLGSTVPKIDALAGVGPGTQTRAMQWQQDPMLARDHEVFKAARRFTRLRRSCITLQQGDMQVLEARGPVLALSRQSAEREMLVVVNNSSSGKPVPPVAVRSPVGTVFRHHMGENREVAVQADGRLAVGGEIPGNTVWVWSPAEGTHWNAELDVALCDIGR